MFVPHVQSILLAAVTPTGAGDEVIHNALAMSRMWGGYHIRTDNEEGLILGRKIAMYSWPKYRAYFDGTAKPSRE